MSWSPHRTSRSSQERARAEKAQYVNLPRQVLSHATPGAMAGQKSTTDTSCVTHNPLQAQQLSESADNALQSEVYPTWVGSNEVVYQAQQTTFRGLAQPGHWYNTWYASTFSLSRGFFALTYNSRHNDRIVEHLAPSDGTIRANHPVRRPFRPTETRHGSQ